MTKEELKEQIDIFVRTNGKLKAVDFNPLLKAVVDLGIEVDLTTVNNGTNNSVFYNDNGVFSETSLTYETKNGYEVLSSDGVDGGFFTGLVELLPSISLPLVGLTGYPNTTGIPYINGVMDGFEIGQPLMSINGWVDAGGESNTSVQITADGRVRINADSQVSINSDSEVSINSDSEVSISALNDIWVGAGDENSTNTNISFTGKTFKNGQLEEYFFKLEDEHFRLGNNSNGWSVVFGFDLLNKTATFDSHLMVNNLQIAGYSPFGQQFQTGQSHTVDDLILVLQSMRILTQ
jgi:hypothetical protein